MRFKDLRAPATCLVLVLHTVDASEIRPPGPGPRASAPATIPFELVAGYLIVVKGEIDGLSARLVIDTGTERTIIDSRIADALRLPRVRATMMVFGERFTTEMVAVRSLRLAGTAVGELQVLTEDLSSLQRLKGIWPDAVVGTDALGRRCLTIDYASRTMTFACGGVWRSRATFDPRSTVAVVETAIDDAVYRLIVDTGSEAIVVYEGAIPAGQVIKVDGTWEGTTIRGTRPLKRFRSTRFAAGGHPVGRPPVFIMPGGAGTCEVDGVLGTRWLGPRVHLDLGRGILGWE
jgi:hypothetical protein